MIVINALHLTVFENIRKVLLRLKNENLLKQKKRLV